MSFRPVVIAVLALALSAAVLAPQRASAQRRQRRARTPVSDLAPIGVGAGIALMGAGAGIYLATPREAPEGVAPMRGGFLMDEQMRIATRATSLEGQQSAMNISDLLMLATIVNAGLLDGLITPLVQEDPDLAWQASAAHATALGLTLTIGGLVKTTVARARPYERECAAGQDGCDDGDIYQSFYSLHTGIAFTEAGFSCAMHMARDLYGDPGADALACGASLAMAASTGVLRIAADRHYLTDVLVGGALGFAVGYLVPLLLVPARDERRAREDEPRSDFSWTAVPTFSMGGESGTSIGVSISGTF